MNVDGCLQHFIAATCRKRTAVPVMSGRAGNPCSTWTCSAVTCWTTPWREVLWSKTGPEATTVGSVESAVTSLVDPQLKFIVCKRPLHRYERMNSEEQRRLFSLLLIASLIALPGSIQWHGYARHGNSSHVMHLTCLCSHKLGIRTTEKPGACSCSDR